MFKQILIAAAAVMAAGTANATTTVYTSQAAYLAALGGTVTTETFSSATLVPGLTYTSTDGTIGGGVFDDDLTRSGGQTTTFDFAGGSKGFAGVFDESVDGFGQAIGFYINGTTFVSQLADAEPGTFYGFVSDTKFTSVVIKAGTNSGGGEHYTLDNLQFGPGNAAVPESATWAMMLTGLGLIGYQIRKRNRRATVTYG